jgi:hypothetical protein
MSETPAQQTEPPKLAARPDGKLNMNSVADVIEWFLNFDERVARIRHTQIEELFQWKQADDRENGVPVYPFENAEARFAIGVVQALEENDAEPLLKLWLTDVLNAVQEAHQTKADLTETYKLDARPMDSALVKAEKLTTASDRRLYLSSCWFDALYTAEARLLGWIYQELYGRTFQPGG